MSKSTAVVAALSLTAFLFPLMTIVPMNTVSDSSNNAATAAGVAYHHQCRKKSSSADSTGGEGVAEYVAEAKRMAADDSIGYNQDKRELNPDVDCSSFVYYSLKNGGGDAFKKLDASPFNTGNEDANLTRVGFEAHDYNHTKDELQVGDILWSANHTEIYIGDGQTVGAHQDEHGNITGGEGGDQTGEEVGIVSLQTGEYTKYYRLKDTKTGDSSKTESKTESASNDSKAGKDVKGWGVAQIRAHDSKGKEGRICEDPTSMHGYEIKQCTAWACVRSRMFGHVDILQNMGNGSQWVASAVALGWHKDVVAPGSIVSWAPGAMVPQSSGNPWQADGQAGHVQVVEAVNTIDKTITISESGSGFIANGGVNVVTFKYDPLPSGMSIASPPNVTKNTAGTATVSSDGDDTDDETATDCATGDDDKKKDDGTVDTSYDGDGTHATPDQAKAIAKQLFPKYFPNDHDDANWEALVWIWNHESSWQWNATNPHSGAYGIPQSLPANKMSAAGSDWKDNAGTQINWGLNYIKERYGTPLKAKAHWESDGWY